MSSWRCSLCAINWPLMQAYETCLECGEKTERVSGAPSLTFQEATKRRRQIEFYKYYTEREEKRKALPGYIPPDAPLDWDRELGNLA